MLKIGLSGYGFMGHMHAQCYAATGEAGVAALADVEADKRREAEEKLGCRTYPSLGEMLAAGGLDAVDICTPTYLHEEQVLAAAAAGKPILCEKPMSLSVASCDRMIAAAARAGVAFMIGQVIRFWPEYRIVKEMVASGRYGRVEWASARRWSPPPTWAWRGWLQDPKLSGGAVLDLHIHDQDYIAWLAGAPKSVQACGIPGPKGGVDAVLALGWGHSSGARSSVEGSLSLSPAFPFNMALLVACEKATIRFDSALSPSLVVYPFEGEAFAPALPPPPKTGPAEAQGNIGSLGGYYNEIKYFLECVASGAKPAVVTPEEAREAVKICLAVTRSAATGRTTEV